MEFNSATLGYIIDLMAGIFIVFSIIFRSARQILVEAETLYDGNPLVYESQLKAFWDGWIGIILLFIATLLHIFHVEIRQKCFIVILLLITVLLIMSRFVIKSIVEKKVIKRYPHYDLVKQAMKEGKYDQYP